MMVHLAASKRRHLLMPRKCHTGDGCFYSKSQVGVAAARGMCGDTILDLEFFSMPVPLQLAQTRHSWRLNVPNIISPLDVLTPTSRSLLCLQSSSSSADQVSKMLMEHCLLSYCNSTGRKYSHLFWERKECLFNVELKFLRGEKEIHLAFCPCPELVPVCPWHSRLKVPCPLLNPG